MKKHSIKKICVTALSLMLIAGCSDEKTSTTSSVAQKTPVSHTLLGTKVSDNDKQKFEKTFENQCVQRELKNSTNPDNDQPRVSKACGCIATFMMKDLTAIEAEKFLTEHENAQSLTIKYENAAYHCLQEKAPPQAAHLFGKP